LAGAGKEDARVPPPLVGVPPRWVAKADEGVLPPVLRQLLTGHSREEGGHRQSFENWSEGFSQLQR
jgi:hypothetical protein